jgi:predicted transcriptional regulator
MELNLTAIRIELAKKNWNLIDLSKNADIPYTTVTSVMSGRRGGTIKTVGKIAKGLGVDVTAILQE